MITRRAERESFDEPSNEAREPRALPGNEDRARRYGASTMLVLPGRVICCLLGLRYGSDRFNFYVCSLR